MEIPQQLLRVAEDLRDGRRRWAKIRTLVRWFGAQRRRPRIVTVIRKALEELGLRTKPDFEQVFLDNYLEFLLVDAPEPEPADPEATDDDEESSEIDERQAHDGGTVEDMVARGEARDDALGAVRLKIVDEPTYQVSHLPTAQKEVVYVAPDTTLTDATTLMLYNEFDQLPVMTSPRSVKGIINWKCIGRAKACGKDCIKVADCMEPAKEIKLKESIFDAFRMVQRHECVVIKDHTDTVCGIVTLHDIAGTFNDLAEPFLLIGEIENLIRNLIAGNFKLPHIKSVEREGDKPINDVSDMTFGQYVRLFENPDNWSKMPLDIDRVFFKKKLDEVREARNEVMHFEPEGVEPEKLKVLREFARFLHKFG